ncbi:MAG: 4-hydroxy-tetrahydrodipicolinate synthase [Pseudomonadota bacterium]|uniref:4-hydroxy-tetrahydrodipicolinate synthase n=1 Tax=Thermithiobacillus tepidarius TaxID=929 RepID=UPI0004273390|nr:4-hydroxy-tetrahydrodipicolinate synthase [Thermithiobacillus tepidarius]
MFQGSMVALVTPMQDDGTLDEVRLRELVEWHLSEGTDAIVAVGTTGESATLNETEHLRAIQIVVEQVRERAPVIAGTGANATSEAIALTTAAAELGADAALLVTPYYNKPTQEGLFQHYRAIAQACPLPQILYNVPGRTGCDLQPATIERLAAIPNIIGVKEATGNITRAEEILARCGGRMDVYAGDDASALALMLLGAKGVISVTANVAPGDMARMCRAAREGDLATARTLNDKLLPLHVDLFLESNPIPVKWALAEMGRIGPMLRLPLTPLSESLRPQLLASMRQAGCL